MMAMKLDFNSERKGQSAIEYLSTYGWALLAIVIVGAVLVQMGVFNQCSKASPRFSGQAFGLEEWQFTGSDSMSLVFRAINEEVDITNVTLAYDDGNVSYDGSPVEIPSGQTGTVDISGLSNELSSGQCASADLVVTYDVSGTDITDAKASGSGKLTARVP